MKFSSILNHFYGGQPQSNGQCPNSEPVTHTPVAAEMSAKKVTSQFGTIGRSYDLPLWSKEEKQNYEHDFAVMLAHGDLESIRLELLAQDNSVLFEFKIQFPGQRVAKKLFDYSSGVELPVIDRQAVAKHRIVLQQHGKMDNYRYMLKVNWGPAETLHKRPGDAFPSEHARKITGGRQEAGFHVSSEVRERLTVTQTGNGAFAFAEAAARGWRGIFLHRRFAPQGFQFRIGQQVTALLVQTPRGIQARAIRNN
jgi:hypothetical protein